MRPQITLALDKPNREYSPGELLSGHYLLRGLEDHEIRAIELSVLWHTEGKGEEDMSVHHFERIEPRHADADVGNPRPFSTVLPNSPLSYPGVLLKICWCVRVRVFLLRGKELSQQLCFRLGEVPQIQRAAP